MNIKRVRYFVRIKDSGSSFCDNRYSKFYQRLKAKSDGKLKGMIYGPAQAREHIAELRRHVYNNKRIYAKSVFEIVREVTTETVFQTLPVA